MEPKVHHEEALFCFAASRRSHRAGDRSFGAVHHVLRGFVGPTCSSIRLIYHRRPDVARVFIDGGVDGRLRISR